MPSRCRCGKAFTSGLASAGPPSASSRGRAAPCFFAARLRVQLARRPLAQHHAVLAVLLLEQHLHHLLARGGEGAAHVVGADGQLAMAAVHEHGQLDARGPAEVDELVEGAAHGAAGVEDVVHQHHRAAVDGERDLGALGDGLGGDGREVVAVEADVEGAHGRRGPAGLRDGPGQAPGQGHARGCGRPRAPCPRAGDGAPGSRGPCARGCAPCARPSMSTAFSRRAVVHHETLAPSGTGRSGIRRVCSPRPLTAVRTRACTGKPATSTGRQVEDGGDLEAHEVVRLVEVGDLGRAVQHAPLAEVDPEGEGRGTGPLQDLGGNDGAGAELEVEELVEGGQSTADGSAGGRRRQPRPGPSRERPRKRAVEVASSPRAGRRALPRPGSSPW